MVEIKIIQGSNPQYPTITMTALLLAGGKSSRLPPNKAFIKLHSKLIIEILIEKLSQIVENIIIVIKGNNKWYEKFGYPVVKDIFEEQTPLIGIYTGLISSSTFENFVISCDMPFFNPDLVMFMYNQIKGYDACICQHNGRLEPLYAIYTKDCLPSIKSTIQNRSYAVQSFFNQIKIRWILEEEIRNFGEPEKLFFNLNTIEDFQKLSTNL